MRFLWMLHVLATPWHMTASNTSCHQSRSFHPVDSPPKRKEQIVPKNSCLVAAPYDSQALGFFNQIINLGCRSESLTLTRMLPTFLLLGFGFDTKVALRPQYVTPRLPFWYKLTSASSFICQWSIFVQWFQSTSSGIQRSTELGSGSLAPWRALSISYRSVMFYAGKRSRFFCRDVSCYQLIFKLLSLKQGFLLMRVIAAYMRTTSSSNCTSLWAYYNWTPLFTLIMERLEPL